MSAFKVGELLTPATLGSMGGQDADDVEITGGSITGITDLAVADGGTGSGTAAGARTNLGLGTMATQASTGVNISGGVLSNSGGLYINGVPFTLQSVNVSGATGNITGNLIFCPDGDGGSPCLAVYDGSSYKRIALGATIST